MRVIAGEAKGRKLALVSGETTRPITDRVKEAVFSILGDQVRGAAFLDLFAGTGGVAIEALSRGAARATLVEKERRAIKVIRANLEATGLALRARVVRQDVFQFLPACTEQFDLVYVAPPQYQGLWAKAVRLLDGVDILAERGEVIVQIYPKEYEDLDLERLTPYDQRKYGSTLVVFYEHKAA